MSGVCDNGMGRYCLLLLVVEALEAHHRCAVQASACLLGLNFGRGSVLGIGSRGGPVIEALTCG